MSETLRNSGTAQGPTDALAADSTRMLTPRLDIRESDTHFTLVADMPGIDANNVEIMVEGNEVTITARVVTKPPPGYILAYEECRGDCYEADCTLPAEIDPAGVAARVKDGVLRLNLPRFVGTITRRITVQAG